MKLPFPLPDGRIVFNSRQPIPDSIPGYTQDPDDPRMWHMDYGPCQHRVIGQKYNCPMSKKERVMDFCLFKQIKIDAPYCGACKVETKYPRTQ